MGFRKKKIFWEILASLKFFKRKLFEKFKLIKDYRDGSEAKEFFSGVFITSKVGMKSKLSKVSLIFNSM